MCMHIVALGKCVDSEGVPQSHLELVRITPTLAPDESVCYEHSHSRVAGISLNSVRPGFVRGTDFFVISKYFTCYLI